jgi:hypothetical protein
MHEVDNASSSEVTDLQSRILSLQALVCELLGKNERLRFVVRSGNSSSSEASARSAGAYRISLMPENKSAGGKGL